MTHLCHCWKMLARTAHRRTLRIPLPCSLLGEGAQSRGWRRLSLGKRTEPLGPGPLLGKERVECYRDRDIPLSLCRSLFLEYLL